MTIENQIDKIKLHNSHEKDWVHQIVKAYFAVRLIELPHDWMVLGRVEFVFRRHFFLQVGHFREAETTMSC